MSIATLVAIYFVVWWVILFAVLPWRVRTQEEDHDVILGTAPSAPTQPMLLRKALATSILSGLVVFGLWLAVERYGLGLEAISDLVFPLLRPQ